MNEVPFMQEVSGVYTSPFLATPRWTKSGFTGPKGFQGFRESAPSDPVPVFCQLSFLPGPIYILPANELRHGFRILKRLAERFQVWRL